MDTTIIITCGATLADIIRRHFAHRPAFEKLYPHDPRGAYGEYLLWTDEVTADMILSRYRRVARLASI